MRESYGRRQRQIKESNADARALYEIGQRFTLYATPEACAAAAQPVFEKNDWQWKYIGVPHEAQLLHGLIKLKQNADADGKDEATAGRLIYYKGQFGFQKEK